MCFGVPPVCKVRSDSSFLRFEVSVCLLLFFVCLFVLFIRPCPDGIQDKLLELLEALAADQDAGKDQDSKQQDTEGYYKEIILSQTLFTVVGVAGDKVGVVLTLDNVLDILKYCSISLS